MGVYTHDPVPCLPTPRWRWRQSTHVIADTLEELHAFAAHLGFARSWFQDSGQAGKTCPHYDLTVGKHKQAVVLGAANLSRRNFVMKMREIREAAPAAERKEQ